MVNTRANSVTDVAPARSIALQGRDPVQLVVNEQLRLIEQLKDLPIDVWSNPSRCEGWSNGRVIAHLSLSAEIYRDSILRALKGDVGPPDSPEVRPLTAEEIYAELTRRQEAMTRQAPTDLVDQFAASGGQLVDLFARLSPTDLAQPAWHPSRTITIGTFLAFRVYELGLHGWDVRASVDPDVGIRLELCSFLLNFVRQAQTRNCRPDPDIDGSCRFVVDGQTWVLRVKNASVVEAPPDLEGEVTIRTDGSTYLLLATRRRAPADVRERISVEGDRHRAERLIDATAFQL
jgi:uncharacterized protein (TIGR03083 family)